MASYTEEEMARLDVLYYGEAEMSTENMRKYSAQVGATGGYDVDVYPGFAIGLIIPVKLVQAEHEDLTPYAEKTIGYFNDQNHTNFKFLELLKANVQVCSGAKFYLTFKAKDVDNGKIETFQGLYVRGIRVHEVLECRIKPVTT
ncbi:uncharacterized protein LOC110414301 [Herrania umbratica]|uniref:Uncharacterized protein LOC110414301 n=1 Tax=Herrania umbratica TaxID=108875 RepID=A0A6J1A2H4_9ROSI|nr:uncharacterized protein LOC110414301 [Herrania umbratica]